MKRFFNFAVGTTFYVLWPFAAALWAFDQTERVFIEKLVPLPFEIFGTMIAAGFFCWAVSLSILVTGLWKLTKRRKDEDQINPASRVADGQSAHAGLG